MNRDEHIISPDPQDRRSEATGRTLRRFLLLGKVLTPHALDGEVNVKVLTDRPGGLSEVRDCYLLEDSNGKNPKPIAIKSVRGSAGDIVSIVGVDSREAAETLKNHYLAVDRETSYTPDADSWFVSDLIGCRVIDTERGVIGTIKDVLAGTSNDNYVIRRPNGQRDLLFPALKVNIVSVDIAAGEMVIILPKGLWEIYAD